MHFENGILFEVDSSIGCREAAVGGVIVQPLALE